MRTGFCVIQPPANAAKTQTMKQAWKTFATRPVPRYTSYPDGGGFLAARGGRPGGRLGGLRQSG